MSSDPGGRAREIFQQCLLSFSTKTCDKQIVEVNKRAAYVWTLFMCSLCVLRVCHSGSWRLQSGGHPEPLVKLHLHQNHRPPYQTSFPSSQPASQPTSRHGPTSTALSFYCLVPMFVLDSFIFLRSSLWFFLATTHSMIKHKCIQSINTDLWPITMSSSEIQRNILVNGCKTRIWIWAMWLLNNHGQLQEQSCKTGLNSVHMLPIISSFSTWELKGIAGNS